MVGSCDSARSRMNFAEVWLETQGHSKICDWSASPNHTLTPEVFEQRICGHGLAYVVKDGFLGRNRYMSVMCFAESLHFLGVNLKAAHAAKAWSFVGTPKWRANWPDAVCFVLLV